MVMRTFAALPRFYKHIPGYSAGIGNTWALSRHTIFLNSGPETYSQMKLTRRLAVRHRSQAKATCFDGCSEARFPAMRAL